MKKATQEEALAVTSVFWDMNMCPVPAGYDPGVVRGCIKRLLEKNGYCGPLNVTAFGKLGDFPRDMLREVYSSGIALINVPLGSSDFPELIDLTNNPPPVNFMLISDRKACTGFDKLLRMAKYNPLQPFPYHSLERLIQGNSTGGFEEEETTGESALWDCFVCARDPPGQCFETFSTHLDSDEHHELMLTRNFVPPPRLDPAMLQLRPRQCTSFVPLPTIQTPSGYPVIDVKGLKSDYETIVFWDVNLCPVPPGFDASLVGPCIKRFLKKEGCFGPLTIIAIGQLTDIPIDILRKVYSSGITLHNVPYGPSDTAKLIGDWSHMPGPPCNIMVLSNAKIFAYSSNHLEGARFNLLQPFPNDSLQSICLADSGALEEEDECSETGDSVFWVCSVCYDLDTPMQGFESFTTHFSGTDHRQKLSELLPLRDGLRILSKPLSEPAEINLDAVTAVFWDMNICPVPPGFDPRQVGPCIKRYLANKGYSGPLTITAIGVLTDVPFDILREIYSSGITLYNGTEFRSSWYLVPTFTRSNPPPANIMAISDANVWVSKYVSHLQLRGYNLLQPFPCASLESFFLQDSGPIEEDKCSDSAVWICSVCRQDGRGFENFTNHVTSSPHERKLLDCLPPDARIRRRYGDKGKVQQVCDSPTSVDVIIPPNHGDKAKVQQVCESSTSVDVKKKNDRKRMLDQRKKEKNYRKKC